MTLDNSTVLVLVLVIVSFLALGSFVGVIILAGKLGAQSKTLEDANKKIGGYESMILLLQTKYDTVNEILTNYLRAEQEGWQPGVRQVKIADWLNQLHKLQGATTNITNITGQAEQASAGTDIGQRKTIEVTGKEIK